MPPIQGLASGVWQTDGGSTLHLVIDGTQVSGTYCSIHGQPRPDETFPITGYVNDDMIAFVTSWGPYKSMTSWSGRYGVEGERECIRTVWHLVRKYADKAHTIENDFWESFMTFTGIYYRVA